MYMQIHVQVSKRDVMNIVKSWLSNSKRWARNALVQVLWYLCSFKLNAVTICSEFMSTFVYYLPSL